MVATIAAPEPAARPGLVRVAVVAGDLPAEPLGRVEPVAFGLRVELHLHNDHSRQLALEHIDFDLARCTWSEVADLLHPSALGERPQGLELLGLERDLLLGPDPPRASLHGQRHLAVAAAKPDLGPSAALDREVALLDSRRLASADPVGFALESELALDLDGHGAEIRGERRR